MNIDSSIKAVLFDHDDTFVGTIAACWELDKHVARTWYNKELTEDELRKHWSKPLKEMVSIIFETTDVDTAMKRIMTCYPDYPKKLLPGVLVLVHAIKTHNLKVGIVTSTAEKTITHDFEAVSLDKTLFDHFQTQEDTDFHKPDPRVFAPTISWLSTQGIKPSEVLYIGDGLHDGQAAVATGFQFIGVETGLATAADFAQKGFVSVPNLTSITIK